VGCYDRASGRGDLATATATRTTNQTLKTVLDRRFVADRTFEAKPVFDENGKLVGTVPITEQRANDVHDAHRDASTGLRQRANRAGTLPGSSTNGTFAAVTRARQTEPAGLTMKACAVPWQPLHPGLLGRILHVRPILRMAWVSSH